MNPLTYLEFQSWNSKENHTLITLKNKNRQLLSHKKLYYFDNKLHCYVTNTYVEIDTSEIDDGTMYKFLSEGDTRFGKLSSS